MKKQDRLIKIDDNFVKIEIYFLKISNSNRNELVFSTLVSGRVFSGNFEFTSSRKKLTDFCLETEQLFSSNISENIGKSVQFESNYQNIEIGIEILSETKICWNIVFSPFLSDIEALSIKVETGLELTNSLRKQLALILKK